MSRGGYSPGNGIVAFLTAAEAGVMHFTGTLGKLYNKSQGSSAVFLVFAASLAVIFPIGKVIYKRLESAVGSEKARKTDHFIMIATFVAFFAVTTFCTMAPLRRLL